MVRDVRFDIVGTYKPGGFAAARRDALNFRKSITGMASDLSRGSSFLQRFALAGGVALGAGGFLGVVGKAREAVKEFDDILDNSKAAGVSSDLFQGLAEGAVEAGSTVEDLNSGLLTFAKNSGLAAEGKGRMVAQLKALNPELLKDIQSTSSQEVRLKALADALSNEENAGKRAAIASAALGDSWDKLLPIFANGARGIDDIVARARDLGVIVPPDLLDRASDLEGKLGTLSQVIRVQLNSALVDLAPLLYGGAEALASFARQANQGLGDDDVLQFIGAFIAALDQGKGVAEAAAAAWSQIANEQDKLLQKAKEASDQATVLSGQLSDIPDQIEKIRQAASDGLIPTDVAERDIANLQRIKEQLATLIPAQLYQDFETRRGIALSNLPVKAQAAATPPAPAPGPVPISSSGTSPEKKWEADLARFRASVEAMNAETAAVGKSTYEHERLLAVTHLLNDAKEDGIKITPELRAQIDAEAEAYARSAEQLEKTEDRFRAINDLADEVGGGAIDAIEGLADKTTTLNDVLADTAKAFRHAALEALFLGKGPLATLLGLGGTGGGTGGIFGRILGLFGGARAGGGSVSPGQIYRVNERGQELFAPSVPGRIIPAGGWGRGSAGEMKISISLAGANGDAAIALAAKRAAMEGAQIALSKVSAHLSEQQRAYN